jgi:hypothetical protein
MSSRTVLPGQEVLIAGAPASPGPYRLTLDLVQEAVAWFRDRGARPASIAVTVR